MKNAREPKQMYRERADELVVCGGIYKTGLKQRRGRPGRFRF